EFPDHTIDATLRGDVMEGFITIKKTNERGLWDAKRVSRTALGHPGTNGNNDEKYQELMHEARQFEEQKNYAQAIAKYTAAIRLDLSEKDKFDAYRDRGNANFKLKRYQDAIEDYDFYIQKYEYLLITKPSTKGFNTIDAHRLMLALVYNSRGLAKNKLGDKAGACEDFRRSCILGESEVCESAAKVCH